MSSNTGVGEQSRKLAVQLATSIDKALNLVPQQLRRRAGDVAGKMFAGLAVGIIFLYAATNSGRSFIHR